MSIMVLSEEDLRRILREELRSVLADKPQSHEDRRVTATEAAAAAGVSPATLRHWASDGKVRRYGEGRNQRFSLLEVLSVVPTNRPLSQSADEWAEAALRRRNGKPVPS